jgi:hypothetical protein
MIIKSPRLLRSSVSVLLLLQGLSFFSSAQAASCPAGTSTVNFTWDGAAAGNKAVWNSGRPHINLYRNSQVGDTTGFEPESPHERQPA